MDIRKLQRAIVDGLEDVKAQNIQVYNTEHLTPLFERVIIASGTSNRQTKALASSVRDAVKSRGLEVLRTEGEDNGEWIIVDCGAAVAHIMQPAIRDYYHLEELWGGKPVRLKLGDDAPGLVKAEAATPAATAKTGGRNPPAAKTTGRNPPAKKTPGRNPPAAKSTGRNPPAAQSSGRNPPAKKSTGRNPPAPKAVARSATPKPAARKTAPAKAAARKTPASPRGRKA